MDLAKKYNAAETENKWSEFWEKEQLFKYDKDSKKKVFSVDTPPPYVSAAHLHAGHAMSYSQAEFIVRYKRMKGFEVFYPMGFDDNGLPTERYVEKKYKINKSKISRPEFIELCLKETKIGGKTYEDFWRRMGLSVDWSLLYSTINPLCQRISQKSFLDLYKKDLLTRKEEPVIWCPMCQTALSQADLEDSDEKSKLNYINFKFENGEDALIATTRPELIPACVALYANPTDKRYKKHFQSKVNIPLFEYSVPVLSDESVDPEYGTGLMMVCTWGDSEDVAKWKKDKLDTRLVMTENGRMNNLAGIYEGQKLLEARESILKDLDAKGLLKKQEDVDHVVGVHERCGTKAEFFQAKQWFINILANKEKFAKRGEEVNWHPQFMKQKFDSWLEGLKWDWNISRSRYYGVPFPVWYCEDCHKIILPDEKDLPVDPTVVEKECPKCGKKAIGETDVMDTWMTSSMTALINSRWGEKDENKKIYPMNLRVQAFEIIRTWLFYSVVKSEYHTKSLPWDNVMISGHGLDSKGEKISKSKGNFKDVNKIIDQFSTDALRYWASGVTLGNNLRFQEAELKNGQKLVNKLWNVAKFTLPHLEGYKYEENKNLNQVDRWILNQLQNAITEATKHFDDYEYAKAMDSIYSFFWNDLADNYIEFVKYRLYNKEEVGEESYGAAQYTIYTCLREVLRMFAPVIPFVTEEIWSLYFSDSEKLKSVHIASWPKVDKKLQDDKIQEQAKIILGILTKVREYKTKNSLAMNSEVAEFIVSFKQEKFIDNWLEDLQKVTGVKKFIFKK